MDEARPIRLVKNFARARAQNIHIGAETPRLAALLLQQYGQGVVDTVAVIDAGLSTRLSEVVKEEVVGLDPRWLEHKKERWIGQPADIVNYTEQRMASDLENVLNAAVAAHKMLQSTTKQIVTVETITSVGCVKLRDSRLEKAVILATVPAHPGVVAFSVDGGDYDQHAIDETLPDKILEIIQTELL